MTWKQSDQKIGYLPNFFKKSGQNRLQVSKYLHQSWIWMSKTSTSNHFWDLKTVPAVHVELKCKKKLLKQKIAQMSSFLWATPSWQKSQWRSRNNPINECHPTWSPCYKTLCHISQESQNRYNPWHWHFWVQISPMLFRAVEPSPHPPATAPKEKEC